jgi:hypothetical protein
MVPVRGEVFVQGRPAIGAAITFFPLQVEQPHEIPTAVVGEDGSFRLTTVSAFDGAPPGEYAITITWCESYRDEGETRSGPDWFRGRYAHPSWSGLKATIQPGDNHLPRFELN